MIWRQKHNVLHHGYTNVLGLDEDLESGGLLRLAPGQPRRRLHRLQHLYVWALYALFPIRWFFLDDFHDVLDPPRRREPAAAAVDGARWRSSSSASSSSSTWALVIPLSLHPAGPRCWPSASSPSAPSG